MNGNDLKNIRHAYGLTQAELAKKIGVDRSTIGRIERGITHISKRTEHELDLFVLEAELLGEFDTDDILTAMEIAQDAVRRIDDGEA